MTKPKAMPGSARDGTKRGRPTKPGKGKPSLKGKALLAKLTVSQERFIERWMVRRNATRAYGEAFPNANYGTCQKEGSVLFRDPRIAREIKRLLAEESKRLGVTTQKVSDHLAAIAFGTLADAIGADGEIMALEDLPRDVAVAVKKVKRQEIYGKDGDGARTIVGHTVEFDMHDKVRALHLLGIQAGMFTEKVEHTLDSDLLTAMAEGRARALNRGQTFDHEPVALPDKEKAA